MVSIQTELDSTQSYYHYLSADHFMSPRLHVLVATFFVIVSNIITYRKSNPVIQSINRSGKKRVAGLNFRAGLLIVIEPSQVPFRVDSERNRGRNFKIGRA